MLGHPTTEQLVAFAAGELCGKDAQAIGEYLATHAEAASDVARLQLIIATMRSDDSVSAPAESIASAREIFQPQAKPAAAGWWDRALQRVAALVFDSRLQPALAGFRSSGGAGFQLAYETDQGNIDLQFEALSEARDSWQVMGQIESVSGGPDSQIAVTVRTQRQTIIEATADESGVFRFEIPRGEYDVFVRVRDQVLILPGIRVE